MNSIFSKGNITTEEMILYRSQTQDFSINIAKQSIISTVKEKEMSDKFGNYKYVFKVLKGVPYIEIKWDIDKMNKFTEIILPIDGYIKKTKKTNYEQFDGVFKYDIKELSESSRSLNPTTPVPIIKMMPLYSLQEYRSLPKNKQTKKTLLKYLDYESYSDIENFGESSERRELNKAVSS
jgi:hypothetical protein